MIDVSPDIDLKFYRFQEDGWGVLENQVDHLSVMDQISPKTSNDPGGMMYIGIFEMSEYQNPIQICITVEGVKSSSSSSPKVAAFTEITLTPYGKLRDNIYHD
jgi:hypothetical protein